MTHMEPDALDRRRTARRNRAARNRLLLLVGVVLLAGAAATVGVAMAVGRHREAGGSPQVVPGGPADGWTHAELAAHLRKRGVAVEVGDGGPDFGGGVYASFTDPATKQWVAVTLVADEKTAREQAGANPKSFAWGRFWIRPVRDGSRPFADRVRAALD